MEHAEHTVTVATSVDLVWEILLDVEGYAKIFPPTQDVELLESSAEHQVARLTVRVNDEVQSWVSRRDIDPRRRVIAYRQVETLPIVGYMGGEWRALTVDQATTQLVLTHDFEISAVVNGKVAGKYLPPEAEALVRSAVEHNSVADLAAVKDEAERRARG